MDFKVRISEAALTDFEEIPTYSWANFPDTAERFGNGPLNHVELLATFRGTQLVASERPANHRWHFLNHRQIRPRGRVRLTATLLPFLQCAFADAISP